jgi:ABC-2 type transport system ATP-binding protein
MTDVINTINLSKSYGKFDAVKNVTISVKKGEIYGFLGLNGAGKTTTIRMMLGMIKPTSGTVFLNGQKVEPKNHNLFNNIGYIVEIPYSYPELSVKENLEIMRKLRGISDNNSVSNIINKLNLNSYENIKAKHLSMGNAQRLGIAKALLHNPQILILDEPSNGLDPSGIVEIRDLLHDLAKNHGVTIFISSHILGEISKLSSRIGIIHEGSLIQEETSAKLELLRQKNLTVNTLNNIKATSILSQYGYNSQITKDGIISISSNDNTISPEEIARILVHNNISLTMLKTEEEDLESYFLRTISKSGGR